MRFLLLRFSMIFCNVVEFALSFQSQRAHLSFFCKYRACVSGSFCCYAFCTFPKFNVFVDKSPILLCTQQNDINVYVEFHKRFNHFLLFHLKGNNVLLFRSALDGKKRWCAKCFEY